MKEIIITTDHNQIRAAVLEQGKLIEVLDDAQRESRLAGNIYKGKVHNIVAGIQAAFVDIGLGKNAFLYAGDVTKAEYQDGQKVLAPITMSIENLVKQGQEIVVQIVREPVGNKGARVTTHLTLAGRYAVLLPDSKAYLGISRKIEDPVERQRLMDIGIRTKPENAGLIIRTMAEGVSEKDLLEDIEKISVINNDVTYKIADNAKRGLLYTSSDPFSRLLRETIDDQVEKIVIDNGELADLLRKKLGEVGCLAANKVWTDLKGDLFQRYDIHTEIRNALQPRVALSSGGYLVIEKTEALTAIDINSGKYIGKNSLQDTMCNLNLEAADEISRQIRLRNLSGMILLDFIDMEKSEDWERVLERLEKSFVQDKVKCKVVGKTKLGLVEVTRKKEGQTLAARYSAICPHCSGKGWVPIFYSVDERKQ